jgi:hypothetical protein
VFLSGPLVRHVIYDGTVQYYEWGMLAHRGARNILKMRILQP